jgi:signal transduction histidine kinase
MLVAVHFVVAITIGLTLVLTKTLPISSPLLWIIVVVILFVNSTASVIFFIHSSAPTKDLMGAIVNIAGEKSALTPPNPNNEKYEKSGFRDALQTIYALSAKSEESSEPKVDRDENIQSQIKDALDVTTTAFIALNKNREVVYSNNAAPVSTNNSGQKVIELVFNGSDTLNSWLDECSEHSVHEEKIWPRVPDRLPNEEGRRFFDVYASYEKGSPIETVLTLVDRTSSYIVDEENLDFISFAAHELRGPITVIRGYLDVLQDELQGVLVDDQGELFHRLIVSSNRLSGYIDNILNTSRYDRRHLKINLAENNVSDIYDTISDDMRLRAGAENRLLSADIPADLPTVAADRASISEALGNLIDNAIKYSNEGGAVSVTARANGNFVDISVIDNGIGMPESVVRNLFQKFYRSHRSRETVAGTGIGLYITKAIVESNGGKISVRSEDGKGSTFTISLPIYSTVADKLKAGDNSNEGLISEGNGWIKNHSMYRS